MNKTKQLLLAALIAAAPIAAQAPRDNGVQPPAQDQVTVTMKFDGGTLKDLIEQLRGQADGGVNILTSDLAADFTMPAIELRRAPIQAALEAIAIVVPEPYRAQVTVSAQGHGGAPVYSLAIACIHSNTPPATEIKVFALSTLTRVLPGDPPDYPIALQAKSVLSAIEAGARLLGQQFDLRFHEESALLFVKGSAQQIGIVEQVLGSLQREQERVRMELQRQRNQPAREPSAETRRAADDPSPPAPKR